MFIWGYAEKLIYNIWKSMVFQARSNQPPTPYDSFWFSPKPNTQFTAIKTVQLYSMKYKFRKVLESDTCGQMCFYFE